MHKRAPDDLRRSVTLACSCARVCSCVCPCLCSRTRPPPLSRRRQLCLRGLGVQPCAVHPRVSVLLRVPLYAGPVVRRAAVRGVAGPGVLWVRHALLCCRVGEGRRCSLLLACCAAVVGSVGGAAPSTANSLKGWGACGARTRVAASVLTAAAPVPVCPAPTLLPERFLYPAPPRLDHRPRSWMWLRCGRALAQLSPVHHFRGACSGGSHLRILCALDLRAAAE